MAIGISGWATIIEPGLRSVARTRPTFVRKPYSLRSDSATSSLPTTFSAAADNTALDLARGLLRAKQRDAERSASLCDIQQQAVQRAPAFARRVLVQLVEHHEHERPGASLLLFLIHHSL